MEIISALLKLRRELETGKNDPSQDFSPGPSPESLSQATLEQFVRCNKGEQSEVLSEGRLSHPRPAPTDTTCMFSPPLPRTGLFPAHWPTTIPAISSFPP